MPSPTGVMRVRVYETRASRYWGSSEYEVKTSAQAEPYKSIAQQGTIDDALADGIRGLLTFYAADPDNAEWVRDDDW